MVQVEEKSRTSYPTGPDLPKPVGAVELCLDTGVGGVVVNNTLATRQPAVAGKQINTVEPCTFSTHTKHAISDIFDVLVHLAVGLREEQM